ncbi:MULTISPECIES: MmcQ/YjbR family DNA-binding protein [unclassified Streptomyces]|uniref:MmcQ/YjbR family DNA-binding protein n=1 Tax=unclassified Streptomyces TaxID=2593676 RepID=UPI0022B670AB|nr:MULTISPECIES: MmcQ/YjbR family DNA-binding protein [unclassified Streptomyces]MCZ7415796.1 MmcQ/YjbR family DNA-binding protein [Streptomyces sp. WMMC897]MCZ7434393.1 MmcQ/YjbR family DNA-binding protein [Streptomyces sp. WMMC1477]
MAKTAGDPMAVREAVRAFALTLPGAVEEFPWGESVVKVDRKVFVFLEAEEGGQPPGLTVKLTDELAHAHALSCPGAAPAGYGLGRSGWVALPLDARGAPGAELLCDWAEESYRAVAPQRFLAELDG